MADAPEETDAILGPRGGDENSNPWAPPSRRARVSTFSNSVFGLLCIALPLGAVCGYANILFLIAIDEIMYLGYGESGHDGMAAVGEAPLTHMIISLAVGGLAVGLLTYYLMPKGINVGFAGVLEAVRLRNAEISWREGLGVALISAISIGCGASVGRYGPAVHIGAWLGSSVGRVLELNQESIVTLLAAGVSGSIASSFHAPFAGVVFVHEVILQHYSISAFAPTTMAAVVGMLVGELHNNGHSVMYFDLDTTGKLRYSDFVLAALLGLLCSVMSLAFMQLLPRCVGLCKKLPIDTRVRAILGAMFLAPVVWMAPQVAGLGVWSIRQSFTGVITLEKCAMLVLLKLVATIISFALGFNGGVFAPAVFMGALLGSLTAHIAQSMGMTTAPFAVFAFMGMGAMVASVFGAPLFAVIVILEMTASFPATTLVLVAVTSGYLVSHECFGVSLFHIQLEWLDNIERTHRSGELYEDGAGRAALSENDSELSENVNGVTVPYQGEGFVETTFGEDSYSKA